MSDFKFSCPTCGQHISSDTTNAGMSIACPACQTVLIVPQPPAAPAAPPGLSIAASQARHTASEASHHAAMVSQSYAKPQGAGPAETKGISGLAIASFVCSMFLCVGCVPGIICGHLARRNQRNDPSVQGGGFAIAGLIISYFSLVATIAVLAFGMSAFVTAFKKAFAEAKQQSQLATNGNSLASVTPAPGDSSGNPPAADGLWNLNLTIADFPSQPAAGRIHGQDFTVEAATIQNGVITLRQGSGPLPDRQMIIFTFLSNDALLTGKTFDISPANPAASAAATPSVHVMWKNASGRGQTSKVYANGYAFKLALDAATASGDIPGKIYLCLPDNEKSYVAGTFTLHTGKAPPAKKPRKKKAPDTNTNN
jgi:DNA-directed RNA polymerase subunit RPC12/RpoP